MNPELLRNVWNELTWRRLVAMPLILAALLSIPSGSEPVADLAGVLFLILAVLWGTRQAADAVPTEVAESTWDWQRLSTLNAWQLTWGKLLGVTLFSWYGAAICLAVRLVARFKVFGLAAMVHGTLYLAGAALLGQAVAFLLGLQTVRLRGHRTRMGTLVSQATGVVVGYTAVRYGAHIPGAGIGWLFPGGPGGVLEWYGLAMTGATAASLTLAVYLGWTLLGAQRLMMRELSYRTRPWAWPAFVLFSAFFMAGFVPAGDDVPRFAADLAPAGRLMIAAAVSALLTYAAIFWDDKDPVVFRRLLRLAEAGEWAGFASHMPTWLTSYGITVLLGLALMLTGGGTVAGVTLWAAILGALLFMARDMAIALYFWLSPTPARANVLTAIVLGLLYWVLPAALGFSSPLLFVFIPFAPAPPVSVLSAAVVEFGALALLLAWRWRDRFMLRNA
ncbi:MAG: hypothetical protein GC201_18455 [Alphaproteobacteria bacterium]|nr:hypothetical protein [Alphaproteobacteria bacterium]